MSERVIYKEVVVHVTGDETVSLVKVVIGLLSYDPHTRPADWRDESYDKVLHTCIPSNME